MTKQNQLPEEVEQTNQLPEKVEQTNQLNLIFEEAQKNEEKFTEIQSGEFLEIEDEVLMLAFSGFETVTIDGEEKQAAIFYDKDGFKFLDTHIIILKKCSKIDISKGARIVTLEALGKVEGKKYHDFKVKVL